jgi:hypothetical protein
MVTRPCDPDEHFDVIALMLEPLASCCVCLCVWGGGIGHVALPQFIVESAKNAVEIARRFSNSKSVDP